MDKEKQSQINVNLQFQPFDVSNNVLIYFVFSQLLINLPVHRGMPFHINAVKADSREFFYHDDSFGDGLPVLDALLSLSLS